MIGLIYKRFHRSYQMFKQVNNVNRLSRSDYNGYLPNKRTVDFTDFQNNQYQQSKEKLDYQLRSEQRAAIQQTLISAKNNPQGEFLSECQASFW